jgi:hypothetical protein
MHCSVLTCTVAALVLNVIEHQRQIVIREALRYV